MMQEMQGKPNLSWSMSTRWKKNFIEAFARSFSSAVIIGLQDIFCYR
ncbi:unnamed protein product [Larinioides sclopetarius]|uniref:Uncharacterized protein n=1 Tax=Larinioides sclopetarius TaxID=280406 RepID=A0AAV2AU19_9ARAC